MSWTLGRGTCGPSSLEYDPDWLSLRRTVQDKMTGRDLRLTDEQVALVHRLQRGQFGDSGFNPYEVGNNGWPYSLKSMHAPPPNLTSTPVSIASCGLLQQ